MKTEYRFYCAGEWRKSEEPLEVSNPYTGETFAATYRASARDVEAAVSKSLECFERARKSPAYKREEIFLKISDYMLQRRDKLAETICMENGKPITDARIEAERAAFVFRIAAEECKRIGGEIIPIDIVPGADGRFAMYRRFPIGPVLGISPFNFPLNLVCHKVAPALAAGNTIILRPASKTPLSALLLAEIAEQACVEPGAFSVLPCDTNLAEKMVADDRLKMLTFTGSPAVGWHLKSICGAKKVTLELGGNAAAIIHSDADIEHAAARCAAGAFAFAGQVCISLQRIFIHGSIFDRFTDRFLELTGSLKVGDPRDEKTRVGPMIDPAELKRAMAWIEEAKAGGAKLLCGGSAEGPILFPTVLTDTTPDMKVNRMEVFAPVATLTPYDDFREALRLAGDTAYGLQAGLFTNDARLIFEAYRELEVGGLMVNEIPTFRVDHMPYGGVRMSGMGREGLKYAIEEMTEGRLLLWNRV